MNSTPTPSGKTLRTMALAGEMWGFPQNLRLGVREAVGVTVYRKIGAAIRSVPYSHEGNFVAYRLAFDEIENQSQSSNLCKMAQGMRLRRTLRPTKQMIVVES